VFVNRVYPLCHTLERNFVGQVKSNQDTVCLSIEILSQSAEPFLTCRVPNFDRKVMSVYLKVSVDVIDTYGFNMVNVDLTTVIHFQEGSLANGTVTQND
jgi:hypothetical protein